MALSLLSWQRAMRKASFRGVEFGVFSAADTVGRSTVTHFFPQLDTPYSEDMGKAARSIRVQAFLTGNDYMQRRDRLLEALEKPGPGELVHPWMGTFYVAQEAPARVQHSAADGGMCMVEMAFVCVARGQTLSAKANLASLVQERAAICSGLATVLADSLNIAGQTAWVAQQAEAALGDMLDAIQTTIGVDVAGLTGWAIGESSGWLATVMEGKQLGRNIAALFSTASASLPEASTSAAARGQTSAESRGASPELMVSLAKRAPLSEDVGRSMGTSSTVAYKNAAIISAVWREFATVEACRVAANYTPSSSQEAAYDLELILEAVDTVQLECADDAFAAFADLRAVTVRAMAEKAGQAPELIVVREAQSVPSLVAAWRWTGDISAEADLIQRNGVTHPGFVGGGTDLEVVNV